MQNLKQISIKGQSGFSLIEIMVVVVILGILAALVVPSIIKRPEQARFVKARSDIQAIQSALDLYKLDSGVYPSTDQGLNSLVVIPTSQPTPNDWQGPYLKSQPVDPWGQPYQYLNPGTHNKGGVDVFTYGPKGQQEGSDDAIIGNWQK